MYLCSTKLVKDATFRLSRNWMPQLKSTVHRSITYWVLRKQEIHVSHFAIAMPAYERRSAPIEVARKCRGVYLHKGVASAGRSAVPFGSRTTVYM
jgi:hypothetical protein